MKLYANRALKSIPLHLNGFEKRPDTFSALSDPERPTELILFYINQHIKWHPALEKSLCHARWRVEGHARPGQGLCPCRQQDLPAHRYNAGRTVQIIIAGFVPLLPDLLSLYRAESGSRQHGPASNQLSMVKLPLQRNEQARPAGYSA